MMKIAFILILLSLNSLASTRAIYGEDNRLDPYEVKNELFLRLSKSVAAMINKDNVKLLGNEAHISAATLGSVYKMCVGERFFHQPTAEQPSR